MDNDSSLNFDKGFTLLNVWQESVNEYPDNTAVATVERDISYTYKALDMQNRKLSLWFKEQGIKKGDKIALISENSPAWVSTFFSIVCMGAVVVPLLPDFSATEKIGRAHV